MLQAQLVGSPLGFTVSSGGSAVYENDIEKANFQTLQKAINAYIGKYALKLTKLTVDGKLGIKTLTARNTVMAHMATRGLPQALKQRATTSELATYAVLDATMIGTGLIGKAVTPPSPGTPPPSTKQPIALPPEVAQEVAKGRKFSPYVILAGGGAVALLALGVMWLRRRQ